MRRLLLLVGLVVISVGLATPALARSGSDSSGQHSYNLECSGGAFPMFGNTSAERRIAVRNVDGLIQLDLGPGEYGEYYWEGGWNVAFEDPVGSGNWVTFDAGEENPADICQVEDTEVQPLQPAFQTTEQCGVQDTVTIPAVTGVRYLANGTAIGAGQRPLTEGQMVTITAEALDGYTLVNYTGPWYFTGSEVEECVPLTYSYSAEPVCVADFPHVRFTATGTGDVYIAQNTHSADLARAGGPPITLPWDEHQAIPFPETDWEAVRTDTSEVFDTGSFTLAEDNPCVTATVPGAPTGLTVTPGNASVTATWTAPVNNGGSAITGYRVGISPDGTNWTTLSHGTTTSRTFNGLQNGTRYYVRVQAVNAVGNSAISSVESAVPRTVASVPRSLTAVPTNVAGQVRLSWLLPASNGGSAITDYIIQRSPNGSTGWVTINDGVRTTTSYTVTGLTNGTRYYFRVLAKNVAGNSAWSNTANGIPRTKPTAPRTLTAAPTNVSGQVRLSWLLPASNGGSAITDYIIQRSPNGTTGWLTINDGVRTTTSYTVTGLANGTRYYFRVLAKNGAGLSAPSNVVNSIPRTVPLGPTHVDRSPHQRFGPGAAVVVAAGFQWRLGDHRLHHPALTERHDRMADDQRRGANHHVLHRHWTGQRDPLLLPGAGPQRRRDRSGEQCDECDSPHEAVSARSPGHRRQCKGDAGVDPADVQWRVSDHALRAPTLDQSNQWVGQPEHHDPGDDTIIHSYRPTQRHPLLLPHRGGQRRRYGTMECSRQRRAGRRLCRHRLRPQTVMPRTRPCVFRRHHPTSIAVTFHTVDSPCGIPTRTTSMATTTASAAKAEHPSIQHDHRPPTSPRRTPRGSPKAGGESGRPRGTSPVPPSSQRSQRRRPITPKAEDSRAVTRRS